MMKCAALARFACLFCLAAPLLFGAEAQAGLTCVPFARAVSAVKLEGDAWSWWSAAEGRYRRSHVPAPGAVLVMKRTERLRYGHVAVVSALLNSREILLDHANWNPGEIARGERAIDVSENNDWSQVRVWNDASDSYGVNVYPSYGFVHPAAPKAHVAAASTMRPEFKPAHAKARTHRAKPSA
jgi:surface antigen